MAFFTIVPRTNKYMGYPLKPIRLRVIQEKGIDITPDFDVNVTDLNNGYKHFKINNGRGDTFKINVIIYRYENIEGEIIKKVANANELGNLDKYTYTEHLRDDPDGYKWKGVNLKHFRLTTLLNYFMKKLTPFMVKTDMMGINQNVPYIITKNKSRQQEYKNYIVWELEFTRYEKLKYSNFTKTSKGVKNALKKAKSKKSKKVSAKTKERLNLRKCKWQTLKFSKTKKVVPCVKILQKILNMDLGTKLVIDGWFGKATSEAVAKYQSKYSKKFGLKKTGHMNLSTYNVMVGKGKQIKNNSVKGSSKTSKNMNSTNKSNKNSKSNSKNKRR